MKRTGQQHSTNGVAGVPAAVRGAAALAILLFSGAGPAEAIGYLPLLGPGPLRFQAPPRPATAAALPPLSMGETGADKPDQAATKPAPTNDTASVADKVTSANPNLLETKAADATPNPIMVLPIPIRPGASAPPPVSAQALLKFFQANPTDTNRSDAAVLLPLEFVPPTPFGPPASKSTFEIK